MDPPTANLDLRRFEADAAFSTALAELQAGEPAATVAAEAKRAAAFGFSWIARPFNPNTVTQVSLRHKDGGEVRACGDSPTALLAGLLGHPLAHDWAPDPAVEAAGSDLGTAAEPSAAPAAEPEQHSTSATPSPAQAAPAAAQVAAESLAAATSGVVVAEVAAEPDPSTPLTKEEKDVVIKMVLDLEPEAQRSFKIYFRSAFRVPSSVKSVANVITEHRHRVFCETWMSEYFGRVAP
jgi:hypothetical protein